MESIVINGFVVDVEYDTAGCWKLDKIYIYDPQDEINDRDIKNIISYLYEESFIQDRSISYCVFGGGDLFNTE
tara:strand:+ start:370 stop:588 length:219 start_codon:yes stop_codon:yes gene_type:complete